MDVTFYELSYNPLEKIIPKLCEKIFQQNLRAVIVCDDELMQEVVDNALWTFSKSAFIPHARETLTSAPHRQPILISKNYNISNHPEVVLILDGRVCQDNSFKRVLDIFNGNDDLALQHAQKRANEYTGFSHPVKWWKETKDHGWEKKNFS